jgi:hypothetical protein
MEMKVRSQPEPILHQDVIEGHPPWELPELNGEFHHFALGPAAVVAQVAIALPEERAMAAVLSFEISDVGIGNDLLARIG